MSELIRQRCFTHAGREAVARCPQCRRYFCRECVTEHAGRLICASCLKELAASGPRAAGRLRAAARALGWAAQCLAGLLIVWTFFYLLGLALQLMPTPFHEGHVWGALLE